MSLLQSLADIRNRELEDARRAFTASREAEIRASDALIAAENELLRERDGALETTHDDALVEAFARWLPVARKTIARRREELAAATSDVALARAAMIQAGAAAKAIEKILATRSEEARREDLRREQIRLDDVKPRAS